MATTQKHLINAQKGKEFFCTFYYIKLTCNFFLLDERAAKKKAFEAQNDMKAELAAFKSKHVECDPDKMGIIALTATKHSLTGKLDVLHDLSTYIVSSHKFIKSMIEKNEFEIIASRAAADFEKAKMNAEGEAKVPEIEENKF